MNSFPNLSELGDADLKDFLQRLVAEERQVIAARPGTSSYERQLLHGKADIVRAEIDHRIRRRRERGDGTSASD